MRPRLLLPALLLLAGAASAAPPPVLRVAMDTRTPPWVFVPGLDFSKEDFRQPPKLSAAQLRKLVGFDVEVASALARRLGMRAKLVPTSWFGLERGLLAGDADVIVSSWTPNPGTPPEVAASVAYCDWGLVLTVRAGETAIHAPGDLEGRRVGHLHDPAVSTALSEMGEGQFTQNDDADKLFADLKAGLLDAVIIDSFYARWRTRLDPTLRIVGEPLNRLGYHVGVRKADAALLQRVDAAIRELLASGELAALRRRWEGAP